MRSEQEILVVVHAKAQRLRRQRAARQGATVTAFVVLLALVAIPLVANARKETTVALDARQPASSTATQPPTTEPASAPSDTSTSSNEGSTTTEKTPPSSGPTTTRPPSTTQPSTTAPPQSSSTTATSTTPTTIIEYPVGSVHDAVLKFEQPPCWNTWLVRLPGSYAWQALPYDQVPKSWAPGPVTGSLAITAKDTATFTANGLSVSMWGGKNAGFTQECAPAP